MTMQRQGEQCGNQSERCHCQSGRLTVVADSSGQAMMASCKEERTMVFKQANLLEVGDRIVLGIGMATITKVTVDTKRDTVETAYERDGLKLGCVMSPAKTMVQIR